MALLIYPDEYKNGNTDRYSTLSMGKSTIGMKAGHVDLSALSKGGNDMNQLLTTVNSETTQLKRFVTFIPQLMIPLSESLNGTADSIIKADGFKQTAAAVLSALNIISEKAFTKKEDWEGTTNSGSGGGRSTKGGGLLKPVLTKNGAAEHLYIALPYKAQSIAMSHSWALGDNTAQGAGLTGGFTGLLKKSFTGLAKSSIVKAANTLTGGAVDNMLYSSGEYQYTPQRAKYSGSSYNALNFSWNFIPADQNEARQILKICKSFQYFSTVQSPDGQSNVVAPVAGRVPAIWRIDFPYIDWPEVSSTEGGQDLVNYLRRGNQFRTMVCTNVAVKYGEDDGGVITTFPDGMPNVINLSLTFTDMFSIQSAEEFFGGKFMEEIDITKQPPSSGDTIVNAIMGPVDNLVNKGVDSVKNLLSGKDKK